MPLLTLVSTRRIGARAMAIGVASVVAAAVFVGPADASHPQSSSVGGHAAKFAPMVTAKLTGAKEVPGPGDPNGRGSVMITLKKRAGKVCAHATWRKIGKPFAAHIHKGGPQVAGDVVVDLSGAVTGGAHCTSAPRPTIKKIIAHPKRFYFNIHTGAFSGGAIRGQLHRMIM
jgi:hypothetical protein